jgi:hypothetical protein
VYIAVILSFMTVFLAWSHGYFPVPSRAPLMQIAAQDSVTLIRQNVQVLLKDAGAWTKVLAHPGNSMGCVRETAQASACDAKVGAPEAFDSLLLSDGTTFWSMAKTRFREDGTACVNSDTTCPIRMSLFWEPVCAPLASGGCAASMKVRITGEFTMKEGDRDLANFSALDIDFTRNR